MPLFFFPVDYGGHRCSDERGEHFPTAAAAAEHARLIARELSRNHSKSVTVFVVAAAAAKLIASARANDTEEERVTRRA